jgi:hypothetical protein
MLSPAHHGQKLAVVHVEVHAAQGMRLHFAARGMFLKAFQRVHVAAGESRVVLFQVHRAELRGDSISVGGGQPDGASLGATLPK